MKNPIDIPTDKKARKINSFFSDCIKLDGNAEFHGSVRIDGQCQGKIMCNSTIFVGKYSKIEGDITSNSVFCEGEFHGIMTATENLHLAKSGQLRGEIKTPDFTIEENAFFEGYCQVLKPIRKNKSLTRKKPRTPIPILDT